MKTIRHHQLCSVLVEGERLWLIWFDDEEEGEGVLVRDGQILCWQSESAARAFAAAGALTVEPGPVATFDADLVMTVNPAGAFPGADILGLWNLFTDIAASLEVAAFGALSASRAGLYARLCETSMQNLLGGSPPPMNRHEIAAVLEVVRKGREMLLTRRSVIS